MCCNIEHNSDAMELKASMTTKERRETLLEIVQRKGFASLPDLAEELQVSESTVRRDLAHLEKEGGAKRTHGGAFYAGPTPHLAHFKHRQEAQWDQKRAIAKAAAGMIDDGDTVLLDGGSTTYELAQLLTGRPLQVVTNSLPVANLFSGATNVELIVVGGYVHPRSGAIYGPYADDMLKKLRVRKTMLSAAAIDQQGLYNNNHMLASTQAAMIEAGEKVIFLADQTKFGRQSLAPICGLDQIDCLVVDEGLKTAWQKQLKASKVNFVLAPIESEVISESN